MRALKVLLMASLGLAGFGLLALAFYLGFHFLFALPGGSLGEAANVLRDRATATQQMIAIARDDPDVGWVEPGAPVETLGYKSISPQLRSDYAQLVDLLNSIPARDLRTVRNTQRTRLLRVSFSVFDPGLFGRTKAIIAQWSDTGASAPKNCRDVGSGWSVCPV